MHACLFPLASSNQQMSGFQALDYSLMPRRLSSVFMPVIACESWAISSVASLCIRLKSLPASRPTDNFSNNLRRCFALCIRDTKLTRSPARSSFDFARRCGWAVFSQPPFHSFLRTITLQIAGVRRAKARDQYQLGHKCCCASSTVSGRQATRLRLEMVALNPIRYPQVQENANHCRQIVLARWHSFSDHESMRTQCYQLRAHTPATTIHPVGRAYFPNPTADRPRKRERSEGFAKPEEPIELKPSMHTCI